MGEIKNISSELAADKLQKEAEAVKGLKGNGYPNGILREMAGPICSMLVRFCYQDEIFAQKVLDKKEKFSEAMNGILKLSTRDKPVVSDLDAYISAVRFYVPEGKVTMSCRVVMPVETLGERDDDLLDLGIDDTPTEAIILELPLLGED